MRLLVSALSCNPSLGSEALVGFKYAEALSRRYETVIIAAAPSQAPEGAALLRCDAGQCSFNEVSAGPLLRFELRQQRIARRLRNQFPFDYVHRITPSAIQEPTWAGRLGKPLIIGPLIAADAPPLTFARLLNRPVSPPKGPRWRPSRVAGRIYRTIVTRAEREQSYLHHARRILVGTRTALRQVPEHLREKCRLVTYSGVEHEVFVPPPARPVTNTVRLLFVGRLIPYKGVELLLRAVEIAARRCSIKLDIVGGADPVYKNFLLQLIQELRLESSVNFLSPVPRHQLPSLYQRADVFCFPTLCDTYGIALLEAMSCGCAVLVSDVAGAGEIVNGENGLKVRLDAPDEYIREYAEKIVALAQNHELRASLGERARKFIRREHDWDRIGDQILAVYDELEIATASGSERDSRQ
jgi:glycosyltransferase involved in cell wall biosynthesis